MNPKALMMLLAPLIFCLFLSLLTGCATITTSPKQGLKIETQSKTGKSVMGCECVAFNDKGKWWVKAPDALWVNKSAKDLQIECKKPGFKPSIAKIKSYASPAMMANMIVPGGSIGALIDHSKGTAYLYPTMIRMIMEPA